MAGPGTVAELTETLRQGGYLADRGLAPALFVALSLDRPILLAGGCGGGKTEVATVTASVFGRRLMPLHGYAGAEREAEIVLIREPGIPAVLALKVVAAVHRLRELDLAKPPGVAETIDWARTLDFLGETDLQADSALDTLGAVIKDRDDLD